jgi:hypothetical protein
VTITSIPKGEDSFESEYESEYLGAVGGAMRSRQDLAITLNPRLFSNNSHNDIGF